jgi:class 3 adenylate cyclase/predicted ATPase
VDVASWLQGFGLERYEPVFRKHEIDAAVLPELTDEHLRELGLPLGPRLKLLKAIAALRAEPPAPGEPPPTAGPVPTAEEEERRAQALPPSEAERRQLTVLFCDLVGSTDLAGRLDPEDLRDVIRAYQDACAGAIVRFEGHVAKFMGDGVLAYFGYPRAHEDDAERAVCAGLQAVRAVGALAPCAGGPLAARVGIATGLVVVGDLVGEGAAQEQAVVGETPNLAARLQSLAEPGDVVVAPTTRRLLGGLFEYGDLGMHRLKGFAAPVRAWRVLGGSRAEGRFEARHAAGLTPLVGREYELGLLLDRWRQARDGEGQVVLLGGEPGVGKSRLVRALRERLAAEAYTPLSHFCSPYHQGSTLHPVIDLLERAAGLARDDPPERQLDKLEAMIALATDDVRGEPAPLLADLLAIPTGGRYLPLALSPQRRKERTLAALLTQLERLAAKQPVLALYEDVHWADPTTLELLDLIVDRVPGSRALVVITFRPEFRPPWIGFSHVTLLTLNRLNQRQVHAMAERVTGGKALPPEVLGQIVAKTDGVPLFVEELTKTVLESGLLREEADRYTLAGPLAPLAIPATLYDSLMARLDRLAPVREVAQVGAVIGREFGHELLAAVVPLPNDELAHALAELVDSELVFRRGTPPHAVYTFKHALVQDAAYASLLRGKRQQLHGRIAAVLEGRFPEAAEAEPELLARHFAEAGIGPQAIAYLRKAGERAAERSAYAEAIGHLKQGLELLQALPDGPERILQELDLQLALGAALMATRGYAGPEVEETYLRARELCDRAGETPRLFPVLHGLYRFHHVRGELQAAREAGEHLLRLAQSLGDHTLFVEARRAFGVPLFWLGEVTAALEQLEHGAAVYDPARHRPHASVYGIDPGVVCLSYAALALWQLGRPRQALDRSHEALSLARNLSHPQSVALALVWGAWLRQLRREPRPAREHAEAAAALCAEQGFPLWLAMAVILLGWASAEEGQEEEGIARMRQGLADLRATGAGLWRPSFLALLAKAHGRVGRVADGLGVLDEAFAMTSRNGERAHEAELHRIQGELLLAGGTADGAGAEACFREALAVARRQEARSFELRAATSLARLYADRGRCAEAHYVLAPVHGWFTEGFSTADLKEAKILLEEWRPCRLCQQAITVGQFENGAQTPSPWAGEESPM